MCDPQTFQSVTPEKYAQLAADAEKEGLVLAGQSGTVNYDHCKFVWGYEAETQTLTIQCIGKPFFVSCDTVNGKLQELFAAV